MKFDIYCIFVASRMLYACDFFFNGSLVLKIHQIFSYSFPIIIVYIIYLFELYVQITE